MNPFDLGLMNAGCNCRPIRKVYVHNLPPELNGKRFESREELMLITNINPDNYSTEIVWEAP